MATLFGMFPFLKTLFADSGYQGPKFAKALGKVLACPRVAHPSEPCAEAGRAEAKKANEG
jgi:hypothetical protein